MRVALFDLLKVKLGKRVKGEREERVGRTKGKCRGVQEDKEEGRGKKGGELSLHLFK